MIVIHVGLRKSGSSSIQSFLSANEDYLRGLGVDYPRVGRLERANHVNLANEVLGRRNFDPRHGTLAELADYRRGTKTATMILSSEMFEECQAAQAARLKDSLEGGDEAFRIVLIVRDLVEVMASLYAQKVKYGRSTLNFDAFFEARVAESRVAYFETARRWAQVFGWENLRVRLLDPARVANGDLNDDFLEAAGVEIGEEAARRLRRPGVVNESPGWRVLEAARALFGGRHGLPAGHPLATAGQRGQDEKKALGRLMVEAGERRGWNEDRGRYLTRAHAGRCLEIYAGAIEAFNEQLPDPLPAPLDLNARGFQARVALPDVADIPRGELLALYDEVGARDRG